MTLITLEGAAVGGANGEQNYRFREGLMQPYNKQEGQAAEPGDGAARQCAERRTRRLLCPLS